MKKKKTRNPIGYESYQKVAHIGLRNPDSSYLLNVPLFVKVSEVNVNGMTDMQEELIHRISEAMIKRYDTQISNKIAEIQQKTDKNFWCSYQFHLAVHKPTLSER